MPCFWAWVPIACIRGGFPGEQLRGALELALPYLLSSARRRAWTWPQGKSAVTSTWAGQHVVVLGGGDTAMDCNRTVHTPGRRFRHLCLPARRGQHARESLRELHNAREEGVKFLWNRQPVAITGDGRVAGIRLMENSPGSA